MEASRYLRRGGESRARTRACERHMTGGREGGREVRFRIDGIGTRMGSPRVDVIIVNGEDGIIDWVLDDGLG